MKLVKMKIDKYGYDLTFFNGIFIDKENFMVEEIMSEDNSKRNDDDELNSIMVVEVVGHENFETMCQELIDVGYLLSSTNSYIMPENYNFQTKYIAIFAFPEVFPSTFIFDDEDSEGEEWKEGKKKE